MDTDLIFPYKSREWHKCKRYYYSCLLDSLPLWTSLTACPFVSNFPADCADKKTNIYKLLSIRINNYEEIDINKYFTSSPLSHLYLWFVLSLPHLKCQMYRGNNKIWERISKFEGESGRPSLYCYQWLLQLRQMKLVSIAW